MPANDQGQTAKDTESAIAAANSAYDTMSKAAKQVAEIADAVLFLRGRVSFRVPGGGRTGPAGAPSVLIAYGARNVESLKRCGIDGALVALKGEG